MFWTWSSVEIKILEFESWVWWSIGEGVYREVQSSCVGDFCGLRSSMVFWQFDRLQWVHVRAAMGKLPGKPFTQSYCYSTYQHVWSVDISDVCLLPYWLIFSSEPLKIQLTMDLCKETIYWFTLCVICWKTLKKCYPWLALHVNIVQWSHCKPFLKHGTRALPMLLQICQDGMAVLPFLALLMYLGKEYFTYNTSTPPSPQTPTSQPILLLLLACKSIWH